VESMKSLEVYKEEFKKALLELNRLEVTSILEKVKEYEGDADFVEDILVPVLEDIGAGWEKGTVALSQVYVSGRICEELIDILFPMKANKLDTDASIAIVTYDDFHPLGKKIVYSTFRASGINLLDYGFGVEEDELIEKVIADNISILVVSVLMLPSALRIKDLKARLNERGVDVKILVGGAPFRFDSELWKEVGADAMGRTPLDSLKVIKGWKGEV